MHEHLIICVLTRDNDSITVLQENSMGLPHIITSLKYRKLYLKTDFISVNPSYIKIKFTVQILKQAHKLSTFLIFINLFLIDCLGQTHKKRKCQTSAIHNQKINRELREILSFQKRKRKKTI